MTRQNISPGDIIHVLPGSAVIYLGARLLHGRRVYRFRFRGAPYWFERKAAEARRMFCGEQKRT